MVGTSQRRSERVLHKRNKGTCSVVPNVENHSQLFNRQDTPRDLNKQAARVASAESLDESTWDVTFKESHGLPAEIIMRDAFLFEQ